MRMPESTFFNPNELNEEGFRQQIAEEYGVDPRQIEITATAGSRSVER